MIAAAALGSVVSLPFHKDIDSLPKRAFAIAASSTGANYITPLAIDHFHISPMHSGAVAFLIGLFGLSMVQAVIRGLSNADLWALIRQRFGGGQ